MPSSALDQENVSGGSDPRSWNIAGAGKFEAGADGYSTPYGSQYVHFYGGGGNIGEVAQASSGPYNTSASYTLSFAYRLVVNPGVNNGCQLYAQFIEGDKLYNIIFDSFSNAMTSFATVTGPPFTPPDSSLQFNIIFDCRYDAVEVLVDNFVITGPN